MNDIERALYWIAHYHQGQKDKSGKSYVLHLLAVAAKMDTETEKVVALLHDIVEDTEVTIPMIIKEFGKRVAGAINHLTKLEEESRDEYIDTLINDRLALKVKLADLEHNMDMTRGGYFKELYSLTERHHREYCYLKEFYETGQYTPYVEWKKEWKCDT